MAIDKTKIHCPRCGREYEIDPGFYRNRENIECVCGRKWRANPLMEELCTTEMKPLRVCNEVLMSLFYFLLPNIVALVYWCLYHSRIKKLREKFLYVQTRVQKKSDSPKVIRNMDILRKNLDETVRRSEIARLFFLLSLVLDTFTSLFIFIFAMVLKA